MTHVSLAAKYRPQTFEEVVGQDTIKSILSRASEQDKVAPAYLLSGTRGVGKTTLARVFAKALNCETAPTAEPCNVCSSCKRITQGSYIDVVEMDGASNRGIDDIRALRESVGYAPLEGRYKVIIIDEAHMLTPQAFNALLKTLEEPPSRVVFVLATTEQQKFPITILSRCQQYIFRQVPEQNLESHLTKVLTKENLPFEEEGIKLIARRAAGSVRDSMSLLSQCLAFMPTLSDLSQTSESEKSSAVLTQVKVREVLGLAGLELLDKLLFALSKQDVITVTILLKDLLSQGVDLGFFMREFAALWRNLFVLKEVGRENAKNALPDIPTRELVRLEEHTTRFSLTYIHAAWQMTLDNQYKILHSLEPAAGLELLLLNLALLPRLLPVEDLRVDLTQKASVEVEGDKTPENTLSENALGES